MADKSPERDNESVVTGYRRMFVKKFSMNSDAGVDEVLAIHNTCVKDGLTGRELDNAVVSKMHDEFGMSKLAGTVATRGEHELTQQASHEHDQEQEQEEEELPEEDEGNEVA